MKDSRDATKDVDAFDRPVNAPRLDLGLPDAINGGYRPKVFHDSHPTLRLVLPVTLADREGAVEFHAMPPSELLLRPELFEPGWRRYCDGHYAFAWREI